MIIEPRARTVSKSSSPSSSTQRPSSFLTRFFQWIGFRMPPITAMRARRTTSSRLCGTIDARAPPVVIAIALPFDLVVLVAHVTSPFGQL